MSVCRINFDGSSANVTLFSSQKMLLFWKVVVGCGKFAFGLRPAILLHGRFEHKLHVLIFCQNKINSTTLRQMTNDERLNL